MAADFLRHRLRKMQEYALSCHPGALVYLPPYARDSKSHISLAPPVLADAPFKWGCVCIVWSSPNPPPSIIPAVPTHTRSCCRLRRTGGQSNTCPITSSRRWGTLGPHSYNLHRSPELLSCRVNCTSLHPNVTVSNVRLGLNPNSWGQRGELFTT